MIHNSYNLVLLYHIRQYLFEILRGFLDRNRAIDKLHMRIESISKIDSEAEAL